jgi:phospholipid transport system transporter-binding protein
MSNIDYNQQDDKVLLNGELTRKTLSQSFEKKSLRLVKKSHVILNFSAVTKADTAGLAWLLMIIERAKQTGCSLSLEAMPEELIKLATLSAVDSFLPLS